MSHIKAMIGLFGGFTVILVIFITLSFAIGALLWPYTVNTWLVYTDKQPIFEWWMGGLIGLVPGLGLSCIPATIITFILMLFIGG